MTETMYICMGKGKKKKGDKKGKESRIKGKNYHND